MALGFKYYAGELEGMLGGITRAARVLGVSAQILHRWENTWVIPAFRTIGGHRRYDIDVLTILALRC